MTTNPTHCMGCDSYSFTESGCAVCDAFNARPCSKPEPAPLSDDEGMLCVDVKPGQYVYLGEDISVQNQEARRIRLLIRAPRRVTIAKEHHESEQEE